MLQKPDVKLLLLTATLVLTGSKTFSQAIAPQNAPHQQPSTPYPVSLYQQATQPEAHLFNGPEYVDYRRLYREGHQFFLQDQKATGAVHYDGDWYQEVPLLYDVVTDEVVLVKNGVLLQKLVSEKLTAFLLQGHHFVRHVAPDTAAAATLPTGFYDLLHDGPTQLLVKRKKLKEHVVEDNREVEKYKPDDKFYIQKDNRYHQVKTGKSVYRVFQDKKKELKKHARSQKLKFRRQREQAILALVIHYNSLNP
ncbi:hypothetical protein [Rufibacter psychrotolerans]|uniref:hypothetical protein n=1 Tax=Rufibacter psychrotolerans TaxID=2812556 RepID=UPI001967230C|nr:hypothetical protein [Rufibacter sp. SYSU D00308]